MPHSEAVPSRYRHAVAVLSLGQLVNWAALYFAFSSFVLPMQEALGWSKATLMGAFTLGLTVWGVMTLPVGAAIDRGHGSLVLAGGAALGGIGFLLWSQVDSPWLFYATWCVLGAAMAMTLYEPAFAVITRRFPSHFRDGITTLTLVGGFASTLSFPAAAWLLQAFEWRMGLVAIGLVLLLVIAPLHVFALRGGDELVPEPVRPASDDPRPAAASADLTLAEALHSAAFWLLAATFAGYSFAAAALWAHAVPALAAKGLSEAGAVAVLVWIGPTQVASRLVFRILGRGVTPRRLGYIVFAMQAVAFASFAFASSKAGLIAFAMLFGAASGMAAIVRGYLIPEYFGRTYLGRIGGLMSSLALYARAAAPISAAALLVLPSSYDALMGGLAVLSLVTLVAYAAARKPATSRVV
jgi:hypothetical protein